MTASPEAQPVLRGPKVLLRPFTPADADAVCAACQDPEIQRWTTVPSPYGHADAVQYVTEAAPAADIVMYSMLRGDAAAARL